MTRRLISFRSASLCYHTAVRIGVTANQEYDSLAILYAGPHYGSMVLWSLLSELQAPFRHRKPQEWYVPEAWPFSIQRQQLLE